MIEKSKLTFQNRKQQLRKEALVYEEKIVQSTRNWAFIAGGAYLGLQIILPYVKNKFSKKSEEKLVTTTASIPEKVNRKEIEESISTPSWRGMLEQQLKEQVVNFVKTQAVTFLINTIFKNDEQKDSRADKKAK